MNQAFLFFVMCFFMIAGCIQSRSPINSTDTLSAMQDINSAIESLSSQISSSMLKQNKSKVAITNFLTIRGDRTELGLFLSDKVTNSLFRFSDKFEVVERRRMKSLQEEILLGMTGVIDDNTAQDIGKAAGADAIIIGTITDLGEVVDVSLRLLGTERANVIATATASLFKTKKTVEMLIPIGPTLKEAGGDLRSLETGRIVTKPPKDVEQVVEMEGFLFKLQSCTRSGSNVKCSLLITNNQKDRGLILISDGWGPALTSTVLDNDGNEYLVETVQLGNESSRGGDVRKNLYRGVPVKGSFSVSGVSAQLNKIALINLYFYGSFSVQFRDVPLYSATNKNILATPDGSRANAGQVSPETGRIAANQSENIEQVVEMEGFLFKLQSCTRSGSNVKCSLLITNNQKDRGLILISDGWGPALTSTVLDNDGNEYLVETVQLGNESSRGGDVRKNLYRGVPIKGSFSVSGVSSKLNKIALITLYFYGSFSVQFRDVPLS